MWGCPCWEGKTSLRAHCCKEQRFPFFFLSFFPQETLSLTTHPFGRGRSLGREGSVATSSFSGSRSRQSGRGQSSHSDSELYSGEKTVTQGQFLQSRWRSGGEEAALCRKGQAVVLQVTEELTHPPCRRGRFGPTTGSYSPHHCGPSLPSSAPSAAPTRPPGLPLASGTVDGARKDIIQSHSVRPPLPPSSHT